MWCKKMLIVLCARRADMCGAKPTLVALWVALRHLMTIAHKKTEKCHVLMARSMHA